MIKVYKEDIEKFWGNQWTSRSEAIDFTNEIALFKFNNFIKPVINRLPYGASICEVGAGLGNWLFLSKAYRPDLKLYGVDLSEFSVNFCNQNGIVCVHADTRNIPYPDGTFDAVFSWGVIEHMIDSNIALLEQFRIAKSYLVVDVPFGPSLAHITTRRAKKSRRLSDYEFMIEFGRFFNTQEFKELISVLPTQKGNIKILNNYLVFPGRLKYLEKFVPKFLRAKFGHNIGAIIKK